jgi:hypothetical protein
LIDEALDVAHQSFDLACTLRRYVDRVAGVVAQFGAGQLSETRPIEFQFSLNLQGTSD